MSPSPPTDLRPWRHVSYMHFLLFTKKHSARSARFDTRVAEHALTRRSRVEAAGWHWHRDVSWPDLYFVARIRPFSASSLEMQLRRCDAIASHHSHTRAHTHSHIGRRTDWRRRRQRHARRMTLRLPAAPCPSHNVVPVGVERWQIDSACDLNRDFAAEVINSSSSFYRVTCICIVLNRIVCNPLFFKLYF